MIQSILNSLVDVSTLVNLLMIFVGCFTGIAFGAIPGLSTDLAAILLLPLTHSVGILPGILFLFGVYCRGTYGGSITVMLIGTPETNVVIATVFNRYPLTQKGRPRKVLQMCLFASTIGGLPSSFILLFTTPFISELVLKPAAPGCFALSVLGISIIASASDNSMMWGILMDCLRILIACVRIDASSEATRFTSGSVYLMKKLGLLSALLGVFALPNILSQIYNKGYLKKFVYNRELYREDVLTKEEWKQCMSIILKPTEISALIGAIPRARASVAAFMVYSEEKRASKSGDKFGTGELEGIATPEAANNMVTGCSLVSLFTLGIPGSVAAALLIGAPTMKGLTSGPVLFRNQSALIYAVMTGMIMTDVAMFLEGRYLLRPLMKISWLSQPILFTGLTLFRVAGSYSSSNRISNVYMLMLSGIVMYILQKVRFPGMPFALGIMLGSLMEGNLGNSLVMSDGSRLIFFKRPICIVILLITVFSTLYSIKKTRGLKEGGAEAIRVDEATVLED